MPSKYIFKFLFIDYQIIYMHTQALIYFNTCKRHYCYYWGRKACVRIPGQASKRNMKKKNISSAISPQ